MSKKINPKTILIVEDEKNILEMYSFKFEEAGFKVLKALDGEVGLNLALTAKPDLILLDIILPKIDGFAVLAEIRANKNTKNTLVIMLTNLGQDEDKEKGVKYGAMDYIVKANCTPTDVVKKVSAILRGKGH